MHSYEYIFTAIIVFAILIASATLATVMPQTAFNISEINRLKMAAQKIMTQLTLNPGNPPEWGSNITITSANLTAFGLAKYREIARAAYVLDLDKVQRLSSEIPSPLHIPPSKMIELLNLNHDYGLKIEFIPALSVELQLNSNKVNVNVFSEQGAPIAGANVTARVFYLQNGRINKSSLILSYTRINGSCEIEFSDVNLNAALIVLLVDFHGVYMVKMNVLGDFLKSYFIGNYLILNDSITITNNTAYQVIAFKSGGNYVINHVQCSLQDAASAPNMLSGYRVYNVTGAEQYAIALLAVTNEGKLTVACKNIPSSYGFGEVYPPLAYTLERSVKIGQSTYTLRLKIWRMSW